MFCVAFVCWIATEFKLSEEFVVRQSTRNDIRIAREILRLNINEFRTLLNDHHLFQFLESSYFSLAGRFCHRREIGELRFQNAGLDALLEDFTEHLQNLLINVARNTVPELIGGELMTGFKPARTVSKEEYDRQLELAELANQEGSRAWMSLQELVNKIHIDVPEAIDESLFQID